MLNLFNRIGRKVFKPKILKKIYISGIMKPRKKFEYKNDALPVVLKCNCVNGLTTFQKGSPPSSLGGGRYWVKKQTSVGVKSTQEVVKQRLLVDYLKEEFLKIEKVWDEYYLEIFNPGCSVLIKINLNTADPYPASTSPDMLLALIDLLNAKGINDIYVGDCSSISALPTKKVAKKTGIENIISKKAKLIYFDEHDWIQVPINGTYLKSITIPKKVMEVDRIINLANLKSHQIADFSFGLKLSVGYIHPLERYEMHKENLEEKIAEISLGVPSDLTIIDGREAFVDGGPANGRVEEGNLIIIGTDALSVDVEGCKCLFSLKEKYGCIGNFESDPFKMPQLGHARDIKLGGEWKGYELIDL